MALKLLRPDIELKDLRGNINTRIAKLNAGEYDAIILASTGVQKLGIENEVKFFIPISTDEMNRSMGQATLGIETTTDPKIIEQLKDKNLIIEKLSNNLKIHTEFIESLQSKLENIEITGENPLEKKDFQDFISQKQAQLGDRGRIFVRKSGTQNLARILVEHESQSELDKIMKEILGKISS